MQYKYNTSGAKYKVRRSLASNTKMALVKLNRVLFLLFVTTLSKFGMALVNLDCKPRAAVIETRSGPKFDYYPYFVKLHRCSGTWKETSPLLVKCVPDKVEILRTRAKLAEGSKAVTLEVVNHTSCKSECVMKRSECLAPARFDDKSCKCICDIGVVGPHGKQCSDPRKMWKDERCGCICKNTKVCDNRRKYFDQGTCSCRCKRRAGKLSGGCSYYGPDFDPSTCSCFRKSRATKHITDVKKKKSYTLYWLSAVAVEFFVMVCAFEAFLYSKNSGLIFSAKEKITVSDEVETSQKDEKKDRMTYREILRRQSRLSSSIRKRSSRNSSVHPTPATPAALTSPNYAAEDVFFNE